jgi:phospholipase C
VNRRRTVTLRGRSGIGRLVALVATLGLSFAAPAHGTPIQHVVVIDQENHSFDNVLGRLCPRLGCDGATTGKLPDGRTIRLGKATDIVPNVVHSTKAQATAIDGGKMDGFANVGGCGADTKYRCLTQFTPSQIPNLADLATKFAVSDRTFELNAIPSWGAHIELVAAKLDGFTGDNPTGTTSIGWGCDSNKDAPWRATPSSPIQSQPSCIPDYNLDPTAFPFGGAYRSTPVKPIPTIMDELDQAGLGWRFYSSTNPDSGYSWATCPTFAECLYTDQHTNLVPRNDVLADAQAGSLPAFSLVLPNNTLSQHNSFSMATGDNWIGQVVSAIENGPDWGSTAIFITYDDCGCFYDHVAPPPGLGIRVPMVIVSPYAKSGFVDSNRASFASLLAFTEHTFGLPTLGGKDSTAYDYSNAFDYGQTPNGPATMTQTSISTQERQTLKTMPHPQDGS